MADNDRLVEHLERKLKIYEAASDADRYAELAKATKAKLEKLTKPKKTATPAAKPAAKKSAKK